MDFPILAICDDELGEVWLRKHFHPQGLYCPECGTSVKQSRFFGRTRCSHATMYRCQHCQTAYTIYTGTLFARKQLHPAQVILLLRGICKGETTASLSRELHLAYDTVHHLRQQLQELLQDLIRQICHLFFCPVFFVDPFCALSALFLRRSMIFSYHHGIESIGPKTVPNQDKN